MMEKERKSNLLTAVEISELLPTKVASGEPLVVTIHLSGEAGQTQGSSTYNVRDGDTLVLKRVELYSRDKFQIVADVLRGRDWLTSIKVFISPAYLHAEARAFSPITSEKAGEILSRWLKESSSLFQRAEIGRGAMGSTGCDPEVFALSPTGQVIPAFEFLPSKQTASGKGMPFWDGFQAEFNPPAAGCLQGLSASIREQLSRLRFSLLEHDPKARLWAKSVVDVDQKILEGLPDEFVALGCLASQNAYPDEKALDVGDPRSLLYRTAGCHIHLGIGSTYHLAAPRVVKAMDSILGVVMTSLFQGMEDPRRRILYGRAGEYRLPAHGIEYRVPPAEVLSHPVVYMLCFDLARLSSYIGLFYPHLWNAKEGDVRRAINESDVRLAQKILKQNKDALVSMAHKLYGAGTTPARNFETLVFSGARNWLPLDRSIEENWQLPYAPDKAFAPEGGCQMSNSYLSAQSKEALAVAV